MWNPSRNEEDYNKGYMDALDTVLWYIEGGVDIDSIISHIEHEKSA